MSWLDRWRARRSAVGEKQEAVDPELLSLLARARSLPRAVEPPRDLWSGIENRISGRLRTSEPSTWSLTALFPRPLVALSVAALLVISTALSVSWVLQPSGAPPSDAEVAEIAERLRERDGVAEVHRSVVAILAAHRADLPPETLAALDENLRSIDRAIAEIHLALEANPEHHALNFLLAEAYRREADLLESLEWWMRAPDEVRS